MLVVLMAIIDFSRMKIHAATRWLWIALSGGMFVGTQVSCESDSPQEDVNVQPEYGPAPDTVDDTTVPVDSLNQDNNIVPEVLYGPPSDFIQYDVQPEYGPVSDVYIDAIQPLYGALEIIDDVQPEYGPAVDVVTDSQIDTSVNQDIQVLYGPPAN